MIYLLNDVLHHTKYHSKASQAHESLCNHLQTCFKVIFRALAAPGAKKSYQSRASELLDIWQLEKYVDEIIFQSIRDILQGKSIEDENVELVSKPTETDGKKAAPYLMPSSHGDASTPFYDLPASNIIPHIMPSSAGAIDPQLIKPLQFNSGPADQDLVSVVENFLEDIDSASQIDSRLPQNHVVDIDPLGQRVIYDVSSRSAALVDTYYGWSRQFCHKMRNGENLEDMGDPNSALNRRSSSPRNRYKPEHSRPGSVSSRSSSIRHRSLSRSYSPPSPSAYRYKEPASGAFNFRQTSTRSPPMDPRRVSQPASSFSPNSSSVPSISDSHRDQRFGTIPPRPLGYQGPWAPPPPPLADYIDLSGQPPSYQSAPFEPNFSH